MICPSCQRDNPTENSFCGACGAALSARDPRAYTPRHLRERILKTRAALEGERKQVTVLFADVKGSTALSDSVDPEEWHRILDGFFGILTEAVHRFEGTVNQYTGDGIMALFGAPVAHEDHARRGCHAALQIRTRVKEFADGLAQRGLEFGVRLGLHSGEVVVGKIGDDLRMDYTAQGAVVAQASRIESLTPPGCIWMSATTASLVEGLVTKTDLGSRTLRGIRDPVHLFQLEAVGPHRTSLEVGRARTALPLVGREPQLERLETSLTAAIDGNGESVSVIGDPGIGKTRVCLEFAARCRERGIPVFEASCPSDGKSLSMLLGRELLRSYLDIDRDETDEHVRAKVEDRLAQLGFAEPALLQAAFELLEVAPPDAVTETSASETRASKPGERLLELVHRLVQAQSLSEPTVWLIDDVHWIDPGSEILLGRMIEAIGWTRTLLIQTHRPDYASPWTEHSYARSVRIEPLESQPARAFLDALLGNDESLTDLAPLILERTLGNPFFAEEVVAELVRDGALEGERGEYRASAPLADIRIPASIRALLDSRIDALGEESKLVLQTAAVIGPNIDRALMRSMRSLAGADVDAAVDELGTVGLLHRDDFAHPLIREVAYASQLADRREETHAQVAVALETANAEQLGRVAERIAHHWEGAGKTWIARRWRQRAALRVTNIQTGRPTGR